MVLSLSTSAMLYPIQDTPPLYKDATDGQDCDDPGAR